MPQNSLQKESPNSSKIWGYSKDLKFYGLGFLKKKLEGYKHLQKGVFARAMLAEIGSYKLMGLEDEKIKFLAAKAFEALSKIKKAFDKKYSELSNVVDKLERVSRSFYFAMRENDFGKLYFKPGSTKPALGLLEKKLDCDLASYLLIQLAKKKGIFLYGANAKNKYLSDGSKSNSKEWADHYLAAQVKNKKPVRYIDAFLLLCNKRIPETKEAQEILVERSLKTPAEFKKYYEMALLQDVHNEPLMLERSFSSQKAIQSMEIPKENNK